MDPSAKEYFQSLTEVLEAVKITDDRGSLVPMQLGAQRATEMILATGQKPEKAKIMLVGNGGSAAIVSHMHNDLSKAVGLRAMVFHETPLLTAMANDHSYEEAYERIAEVWAEEGDLLIAVSSSGQSENILRAAKICQSKGAKLLTFTGFNPQNSLRAMGDLNFYVPADSYGLVEVVHMALAHYLTDSAMAVRMESEKTS